MTATESEPLTAVDPPAPPTADDGATAAPQPTAPAAQPAPTTASDDGTSAEGTWLELTVAADHEAVEAVSEILSRVAPGGTTIEPAFVLVDEGLGAQVDISRPAIVRAYVSARDRVAAQHAVATARRALGHLQAFGLRPIGELETRVVHEEDWAHAWKVHVPVLRIGRRLVIRPSWRRHRRAPSDVVLALDPGMAFGTGLHPTTRLCLAGVERWADEGRFGPGTAARGGTRVLDVGCGSGILSIAAGLFGAESVLGLDTDQIAIDATTANARRNRLARRIRARAGSLPSGQPPFDLVLANLIASLLVTLAPGLAAELRPGGRLLASGIFVDREADVQAAFGTVGLDVVGRWAEGEWVALEAVRRA